MPTQNQIHINQQQYDTRNDHLKKAEVEKIICVFTPTSVLTAALSGTGESVYLNYCQRDNGLEWDETFYDTVLAKELTLRNQKAKRYAFVWSDKQLLIPDPIYKPDAAALLLSDVHHVAADEFAMIYNCRPDKAHLAVAFNLAAETLAQKFLNITTLNPINIFQFLDSERHNGFIADCLVTETKFFATLRKDGKLLWHQAVDYKSGLDIVYQLAQVCQEWDMDLAKVEVNYSSLVPDTSDILKVLNSFFINVYMGEYPDEHQAWWPVFHLAQQLYACVS